MSMSEPLLVFEGEISQMIKDPYDDYCYVSESNNSPILIHKIDLRNF